MRTLSPSSRKYSAIAIAVLGARRRIIGLSSPVATTVTSRDRSPPMVSSRNSRTSRPRSPTSATTTVSKPVARASMPISVDLPTPEPAKMPRRWPLMRGVKMSIALTDVLTGSRMRPRCIAGSGRVSATQSRGPFSRAPSPSQGRPNASRVRPFQLAAGASVTGPVRQATVRTPLPSFTAKGFTVAAFSSMRTTSPSSSPSGPWLITQSPSRTKGESPATRKAWGETSTRWPDTRIRGSFSVPAPGFDRERITTAARAC